MVKVVTTFNFSFASNSKFIKKNRNIIKKFLKRGVHWIQSHPIAGSEVSGPKYGSKSLFVNKWCIIFSDKNKIKQKKLVNFWKKIGSKVIIMDEKVHDKIFSITSHLPHLIAYNLIKTAQDFQKIQKNIKDLLAQIIKDVSINKEINVVLLKENVFLFNNQSIDFTNEVLELFNNKTKSMKIIINSPK